MASRKRIKQNARSLFRLCVIDGALDDARARDVAEWTAASKRRGVVATLEEFQRLVRLDRGRYAARVESAMPLDAPERDDIQTRLTRRYGPRLQTTFQENPALIGGVRIQVGSDVYDGSIRAKLATLLARL